MQSSACSTRRSSRTLRWAGPDSQLHEGLTVVAQDVLPVVGVPELTAAFLQSGPPEHEAKDDALRSNVFLDLLDLSFGSHFRYGDIYSSALRRMQRALGIYVLDGHGFYVPAEFLPDPAEWTGVFA